MGKGRKAGATALKALGIALAAGLWTVTLAAAAVPDQTVEKFAAAQVAMAELRWLSNTQQIGQAEAAKRRMALEAELNALGRALRGLPPEEYRMASGRAQGLVEARLAILTPQWKARGEELARTREQRTRDIREAVEQDAHKALAFQRQRLTLRQQLEKGQVSRETWEAGDHKAEAGIAALRAPWAKEGWNWGQLFDTRLKLLTEALGNNPATPLPAPPPMAIQGGSTTPGDYEKDVALAATTLARLDKAAWDFHAGKITGPAHRETENALGRTLQLLTAKWRAAGQGDRFENDFRQRAAPLIAAQKGQPLQPSPRPAKPAPGEVGTGEAIAGLTALAALAGGLVWFVVWVIRNRRRAQLLPPLSAVHGTASYAPRQLDFPEKLLVTGVFLGKSSSPELKGAGLEGPGAPVCATPGHHTLVVARTGTGKGTRVIVPTLLRRFGSSALIVDPKGANAAITARARSGIMGAPFKVHIVNPWDELGDTFRKLGFEAACYNPLDVLDRLDPNAVAVAQALAATICPPPTHDKEKFWEGSAATVMAAVLLWLADQPGEQKTLARAREIISLSRKEFTEKYVIPMSQSGAFGGAIREMIKLYTDLAQETYSGIMANLAEDTKFLSDPRIKEATSSSDFAMTDLLGDPITGYPTSIYLVIPPDRIDTQKTWLRLVIAAAMTTYKRAGQGEKKFRCLFLIDEFPALGHMPDIPRDLAAMREYGVDFLLAVQGLDQLKDIYGEARGTIINNCAYKWFCNVTDLESAKWLSDTLGKATVRTLSTSESTSAATKSVSESHGVQHGETGRNLLNPDEVLALGRDVAIALQPEGRPHFLKPIDYWNLQAAFGHLQEKYPDLLWGNMPLQYDPNPYVPQPETPPPPPRWKRHQNPDDRGDWNPDPEEWKF